LYSGLAAIKSESECVDDRESMMSSLDKMQSFDLEELFRDEADALQVS
jgi:hypothetical protein